MLGKSEAMGAAHHRHHLARHWPDELMNTTTRAALIALAEALAADPGACTELDIYGHLPEHLADVIEDLQLEAEA